MSVGLQEKLGSDKGEYGGRIGSVSDTLEDIKRMEFRWLMFKACSVSASWLVHWLMAERKESGVPSTLFTQAGVAVAGSSLVVGGALVRVPKQAFGAFICYHYPGTLARLDGPAACYHPSLPEFHIFEGSDSTNCCSKSNLENCCCRSDLAYHCSRSSMHIAAHTIVNS